MTEKTQLVYSYLLSRCFSCTYLVNSKITFVFKVVALMFFAPVEFESKKMRSKFNNVTLAYGTPADKKCLIKKI